MSWLRRIFGASDSQSAGYAALRSELHEFDASGGSVTLAIVGESNYQDAIRAAKRDLIRDGRWEVLPVRLQCEPSNQHDRNAVCVSTIRGATLGYLSRADAKRYCAAIAGVGGSVLCKARLHGGERDKPSLGVWLVEFWEPNEIRPIVTSQ